MNLNHVNITGDIEIIENRFNSLVIENKQFYREVLNNIFNITQKDYNGGFYFSEKGKKLEYRQIDFISNFFSLPFSNKKIIKAIEDRLTEYIQENFSEWLNIKSTLECYMNNIEDTIEYDLSKTEIAPENLIKIFEYRLHEPDGDMACNLIEYMSILSNLIGIKLFIFCDLKEYFLDKEFLELKKNMEINEYTVLMISSTEYFDIENKVIIDKDWCLL